MDRRSTLPRSVAKLPPSLDRRLKTYCVAAGAAGVSVLALSEPAAQAEVIYTPAHGPIAFERWSKVDLNHDGVPDVSFFLSSSNYKVVDRALAARPARSQGGIIGYAGAFFPYASALPKGATIGPVRAFVGGSQIMDRTEINHYDASFTFSAGAWVKAKGLYLGVKFTVNGATHYGWIRLSVGAPRKLEAIITGYAYETVADQPILAGQTSEEVSELPASANLEMAPETSPSHPSVSNVFPADARPMSLGMLALGIDGLMF
ncbi:MAG: hypothetical protein WAM04_00275 [Candidatus Sulfotelmatobacter sp.]